MMMKLIFIALAIVSILVLLFLALQHVAFAQELIPAASSPNPVVPPIVIQLPKIPSLFPPPQEHLKIDIPEQQHEQQQQKAPQVRRSPLDTLAQTGGGNFTAPRSPIVFNHPSTLLPAPAAPQVIIKEVTQVVYVPVERVKIVQAPPVVVTKYVRVPADPVYAPVKHDVFVPMPPPPPKEDEQRTKPIEMVGTPTLANQIPYYLLVAALVITVGVKTFRRRRSVKRFEGRR